MKIAILSRGPRLYSTRRLKEAAQARGHKARVMDTLKFALQVEHRDPDVFYNNQHLADFDAVIPRIGPSITPFGCAVVRQFEQMGVFSLNSSQAIAVSRDKLRSLQVLSRRDIGLPPTAFVRRRDDILPAIDRVGGTPIIIKLLQGTQGVGVILAENLKVAEAIIETLHGAKQNVLIQKFVAESKGKDIRAFVVGGQVVAAMRRAAVGQEFRSNVHRGGTTEIVELDDDYERTAVRATRIMGLHVAGVDILESRDGPQVMEVNSSPGLEGIEAATGVDVAAAIIEYLEHQVFFPDIDLRQRLPLNAGYSVAEIPIADKSPLAGQTLADARLREQDIVVLSINRHGVAFPNPTGEQQILGGDILLCYGRMLALKSLIPPKRPRRRKKRRS
ncbi:MAG: 30S ribosomal protein S6--L-glutamate ligase [Phycisphaerales bacterium]|nr:MAG: 30S ribosomal protein S6--L-glutamate ligase [Phycisphaerales bacterium]